MDSFINVNYELVKAITPATPIPDRSHRRKQSAVPEDYTGKGSISFPDVTAIVNIDTDGRKRCEGCRRYINEPQKVPKSCIYQVRNSSDSLFYFHNKACIVKYHLFASIDNVTCNLRCITYYIHFD